MCDVWQQSVFTSTDRSHYLGFGPEAASSSPFSDNLVLGYVAGLMSRAVAEQALGRRVQDVFIRQFWMSFQNRKATNIGHSSGTCPTERPDACSQRGCGCHFKVLVRVCAVTVTSSRGDHQRGGGIIYRPKAQNEARRG